MNEMKKAPKRCITTFLAVVVVIMIALRPASIGAHPGSGIAVDRLGQVFFLDTGSGLWKIDKEGRVTHLSATLFHWLALDENNLFTRGQLPSGGSGLDWEISKVGENPTVLIASDWPIAIGEDGSLYYQSGRPGNFANYAVLAVWSSFSAGNVAGDYIRPTASKCEWSCARPFAFVVLHRK
jgi:hypothetical protein